MSGPGRPGPTRGGVFAAVLALTAGVLTVSDTVLAVSSVAANTSPDPTAGSADSHRLVPVTGAWTESAVTYNSRPSPVPGTVSGATAVSTSNSVELDAPALGSAYSSTLTSDGADSLRVWSGDVATAAHRPQLVLTFGAE
ncbi:hypothetical protein [Streptomyces sp. ITFR-6]|uniref:hypothetical protein n=1 Tax=Streptomyces sp. ITFR-6 TaxID=3075197 RepID=UPI00288A9365|nr:hypothetical protein [Streptomyces sp. ITFR-6]WNI33690.1 hypothetical protein RLT59_36500 [Streptomyces sp. ITFR-6]